MWVGNTATQYYHYQRRYNFQLESNILDYQCEFVEIFFFMKKVTINYKNKGA